MSRQTSFNPFKGFASLRKWLGLGILREVKTEDEEQRYRPIEWPLIKRLMRELWPHRRLYALGVLLGSLSTGCDMTGPRFMGWLINLCTGFVRGQLPITQHQAIVHVSLIVLAWAAFAVVALILQRYTIFSMTRAGEQVQFGLRQKLFAHLQRLSMSFYDKTKLGRIISRTTSDVNAMREVNVWGMNIVMGNLLMMLVSAIMLSYTDWRLFLSVAWLAPLIWLLNRIYRARAGYMWQVVREGYTRLSTNLAENITGMRVVAAYNRQGTNLGAFNALQDVNTVNNVAAARINGIYQPLLEVIRVIGRVIILSYGGYLVVSGRLVTMEQGHPVAGVGSVVMAYLYWDWFMNPIVAFGAFENQLMLAMASAERVFSLLDTKPDVQDMPDAKPLPRINGRVEFENVTFGYLPDRPVLHGINFTAEPGQMVALVGATGSGKSSIVSLIARFYQPQQGRVLIDGQDIRHVTGKSLNEQTGLVLQVNYLFTGTVMENIRYAKLGATDEEVIAAARAIGSYDAIMSLQDGFNTEVGERGANMSLGQRQLICFTRAFLADPRVFMLDEATSAVDTGTEVIVQESLEKLLAGRTTFIVAHRLSTIMRADMILVIDDGRIIERGTHRQLIDADGKYAHLYRQFIMQNE